MKDWIIWVALGVIVVCGLINAARRQQKEQLEADTAAEAEDEAELEREGNIALIVRDRSRYARNYANDMMDERLSEAERARFRQRYENAKSTALTELLTIKDDFSRGVAAHGVIDLLLAGGEVSAAKRVFDALDGSLQESIMSTRPDEYACLRA
jgi:hypothetical protein